MKYGLTIKPSAVKESDGLPKKIKEKIRVVIEKLGDDPRPDGVKKLKGRVDIYRIRIGDYRILYTRNEGEKIISMLSILHRREAYR